MKKLLDIEGGLMSFLSRIADLLILNLLFIITCIPIVTIGPSLTALYSITLRMVKGEDSYIFTGYLKAFKNNFKISFIAWIILLVLVYLAYLDLRIAHLLNNNISMVLSVFFFVIIFLCSLMVVYLFPYIARFNNTLKQSVKNTALIAAASLPYTIILILTIAVAVGLWLLIPFQYMFLIWLLFGFSSLALLQSLVLRRVFAKFEPSTTTGE